MSEDPSSSAAGVASQLAREVYKDLLHPSAQRVGIALETISKLALSPVALLDWSFEQSKEWLRGKLLERLNKIPPEFVEPPSLSVAVPIITAVAMTHEPQLRDMYAELLLKAIDTRTKDAVHPAYVQIIQQLAPEEATILLSFYKEFGDEVFTEKVGRYLSRPTPTIERQFVEYCRSSGVADPERSAIWLDNLLRLRVLSLTTDADPEFVPEEYDERSVLPARIRSNEARWLSFTEFGLAFVDACIAGDDA